MVAVTSTPVTTVMPVLVTVVYLPGTLAAAMAWCNLTIALRAASLAQSSMLGDNLSAGNK